MSTREMNTFNEEGRQRIAAEVLELGESLFETALEVGNRQREEGQDSQVYPIEEIRATSQEFFTALQLLLRIEE
jgi:transposase-like protein